MRRITTGSAKLLLLLFLLWGSTQKAEAQVTIFQLAGWDQSYEFSAWQQLGKSDSRHFLNVRFGVNDWMSPVNPTTDTQNPAMKGNYSFSLGYGYQVSDKILPYLTIRKDLNRLENIGFVSGVDIQTNNRFNYTVGFTSTYDVMKDWNRSNAWIDIYYAIGNRGWKVGMETAVTVTGEVGFLWMINKSINWSKK
ncbi:hypothetical protein MY04_5309 [Flammeovirga sp. MY04]|uniref:hypothetical protein n=1 Tax=Flammeovirga sp. MY04 TaxID=1191459 RepID=UPI00082684A7|nr:hypothetical protein [Flammeovirga sp. MY04]ANQ52641.2 hypothetical protein MY04_5309 [Flammeovirga sp. MY04]